MRRLTVVTDSNGPEAIYVNGKLAFSDDTVYATDICRCAGDGPIVIAHEQCEFQDWRWWWPEKLKDVPLVSDDKPAKWTDRVKPRK
jgi:hypothetical protein